MILNIFFAWYRVLQNYNKIQKLLKTHKKELEHKYLINFLSSKRASIGELASGIVHEVINPLAIFSGFATKMRIFRNTDRLADKLLVLEIGRIIKTVNRISSIITSLRKLSRDTSHDNYTAVKTTFIISEIKSIHKEKFNSVGIDVIFDCSNDLPTIE